MAVAVPVDSESTTRFFSDVKDRSDAKHAYLQLESLKHATNYSQMSLLVDIAEADGEDAAHCFLHFECGVSRHHATELVRVANALVELPAIAEAYGAGALSFARVAFITHFATPETDEKWARDGDSYSLSQMRALAREAQGKKPKDDSADPDYRSLTFNETSSRLKVKADLPLGLGQLVRHALDRIADAEGIDEVSGQYRPAHERRADALVTLAGISTANDSDPDLATVVIHVDLPSLIRDLSNEGARNERGLHWAQPGQQDDDNSIADVDGRAVLLKDVIDQVCDARFQLVSERDGQAIGIGRVARDIPPWLRRLINKRDHGCRFPNCMNEKGVDAHHIQWWSLFGETNIDNLISLCRRHHRLIHAPGWSIEGDPNGFVQFKGPDGTVFTGRLPGLEPTVRGFINDMFKRHRPAQEPLVEEIPRLEPKPWEPPPGTVFGSWGDP